MKEESDVSKTTLRLKPSDMKALKMFCVENDVTIQSFIQNAIRHCMDKKIIPGKGK